eukprot:m.572991 g.572991  ORF g.572991 m.572991 type:complete len:725 (+) comp22276_c0_seq6:185-2359(+)
MVHDAAPMLASPAHRVVLLNSSLIGSGLKLKPARIVIALTTCSKRCSSKRCSSPEAVVPVLCVSSLCEHVTHDSDRSTDTCKSTAKDLQGVELGDVLVQIGRNKLWNKPVKVQQTCLLDIAAKAAADSYGPLLLVFLKRSHFPFRSAAQTLTIDEVTASPQSHLEALQSCETLLSHPDHIQSSCAENMKWIPESVHPAVSKRSPHPGQQIVQWVAVPRHVAPEGPFLHDFIERQDARVVHATGGLARALTNIDGTATTPSSEQTCSPHLVPPHGTSIPPWTIAEPALDPSHRPGAFIFHCSRCGSTAIANALRAYGGSNAAQETLPQDEDGTLEVHPHVDEASRDGSSAVSTVVVSEPTAVNTLLFRHLSRKTIPPGVLWDGDIVPGASKQSDVHSDSPLPAHAACQPTECLSPPESAINVDLRGIVGALGGAWPRPPSGRCDEANAAPCAAPPPTSVFKLSSWNVLGIDIVLRAYQRNVPWLFLYRDPVEVAVSELRSAGGWLRMGRHAPARHRRMLQRWHPDTATSGTRAEADATRTVAPEGCLQRDIRILATTVAAYFRATLAALDDSGASGGAAGWVLHYNDVIGTTPPAALEPLARDTTVGARARAVACVHRALLGAWPPWPPPPEVLDTLTAYSKQPPPARNGTVASTAPSNGDTVRNTAVYHVDDRQHKRDGAAAVPGLREAVERECADLYARLNAHPRRLHPDRFAADHDYTFTPL